MSLFIAEQAFPSASDFSAAKIPVFAASILSAIVGIALLWGASFQNAYRRGAAVREHAISGARLRRIVNRRFLMILPAGATVAVADGETVRLFRNTGVKPGVHLIEIATAPPAPLHSDSGARHHVGSGNLDGRRLDEDDFAAAAAAFLNRLSLDGTIKHLVVVSDPRTLGEMRKHFHSHLRGRIMREFAKEFSRRPLEEIASLIADA